MRCAQNGHGDCLRGYRSQPQSVNIRVDRRLSNPEQIADYGRADLVSARLLGGSQIVHFGSPGATSRRSSSRQMRAAGTGQMSA